jgi:hypothetical protein
MIPKYCEKCIYKAEKTHNFKTKMFCIINKHFKNSCKEKVKNEN